MMNTKNTRRNHKGKHKRITQTNKIRTHICYILGTQRVIHDSKSTMGDSEALLREEVLKGLLVMGS